MTGRLLSSLPDDAPLSIQPSVSMQVSAGAHVYISEDGDTTLQSLGAEYAVSATADTLHSTRVSAIFC